MKLGVLVWFLSYLATGASVQSGPGQLAAPIEAPFPGSEFSSPQATLTGGRGGVRYETIYVPASWVKGGLVSGAAAGGYGAGMPAGFSGSLGAQYGQNYWGGNSYPLIYLGRIPGGSSGRCNRCKCSQPCANTCRSCRK